MNTYDDDDACHAIRNISPSATRPMKVTAGVFVNFPAATVQSNSGRKQELYNVELGYKPVQTRGVMARLSRPK